MEIRYWLFILCGSLAVLFFGGCDSTLPPKKSPPPLAKELVLYNWAEDMPQSVMEDFTREFGVTIKTVTFESQEEAVKNIQKGEKYDVAVIENPFIPPLTAGNKLAEIDFRNVPNFKNISANFRDLATDPGNRYTVPYMYGTTGLLVRTDLIGQQVTRFADLWNPRYAGKIALRAQPGELIALTLMSLGYSLNSENPQELEQALNQLLKLKPAVIFVEADTTKAIPVLLSGEVVILHGWPLDYLEAHAANPAVSYVLPEEGTGFWCGNYVIPANTAGQYTAEIFINFLLRPEISGRIVNERKNANANEAARPFIKPEIRDDPVIFPPVEMFRRIHFYKPLSPEGEALYESIWQRFLAHTP